MSEPRWYAHPREPGAPQDGDPVVAQLGETHGHWTWMGVVIARSGPWRVSCMSASGERVVTCYADRVRWPTEHELAAYQLDPDGQRTQRRTKDGPG